MSPQMRLNHIVLAFPPCRNCVLNTGAVFKIKIISVYTRLLVLSEVLLCVKKKEKKKATFSQNNIVSNCLLSFLAILAEEEVGVKEELQDLATHLGGREEEVGVEGELQDLAIPTFEEERKKLGWREDCRT